MTVGESSTEIKYLPFLGGSIFDADGGSIFGAYLHPRPRLTDADRLFWVVMSQIWVDWRESLHIVQPETVVRWHRQGFRYYWRWKSRRRGRPRIDPEIRHLIRRMCRANPLWGAPRIHGELLKLGIDVSEAAVSKYMIRRRGPPSQTWRTFLSNHAKDIIALDFFTVPTATFRILFVLIILSHDHLGRIHMPKGSSAPYAGNVWIT